MKNFIGSIFLFVMFFFSCTQEMKTEKPEPTNQTEKTTPLYAKYNKDGKIILRYNYDPKVKAVVNDARTGLSLIHI